VARSPGPSGRPLTLAIIVMAEGSETPGGGQGPGGSGGFGSPGGLGGEGRGRGTEGDLLAERRARRAAELGDTALMRRAEAAEATVQTLETHVASLQQRLQEAEEERRRAAEVLDAEQAAAVSGRRSSTEQELRRARQREYAEQQLRVEAEDRCIDVERESRSEIDRLTRRLGASERGVRELAGELERVQRELAEAEQAAAAELATLRRTERELQARLVELERRAHETDGGLRTERAAREQAEGQLESMRESHRRVEGLVGELRGVVARLRAAAATAPTRAESVGVDVDPLPTLRGGPAEGQREEMADALAAAVERLRARVEDVGEPPADADETRYEPSPVPVEQPGVPLAKRSPHKHSMSLVTRLRIRRKDRRRRKSAAAEPPSMQSQ
jgi:chromosome segregation ATPase